jgi:hypothetical protein
MVSAISNVMPVQSTAKSPTQSAATPAPAAKESVASTDSVTLSRAAQAALAAMQEAVETSTQTSQEAAKGDLQAQRLLARETAASTSAK